MRDKKGKFKKGNQIAKGNKKTKEDREGCKERMIKLIKEGKNVGKENHFYGKKHTEETKRKQSENHRGKKLSEEHKKNMSLARTGFKQSEDYNKKNCNPNNLITLCHKCHQKTNFNRKKWTKYFSKLNVPKKDKIGGKKK